MTMSCHLFKKGWSGLILFMKIVLSPQESIRINFDVSDVDYNPISGQRSTVDIATNMIFEIEFIAGTNSEFSPVQTLGAPNLADLTIDFDYRLICTEGSCGNDCSQTSNCLPFPDACCMMGMCEEDMCQMVTCLNGGICDVRITYIIMW